MGISPHPVQGGDNLGGIMGQRLLKALNEAQENYQKAADRVASLEAQQPAVEPGPHSLCSRCCV